MKPPKNEQALDKPRIQWFENLLLCIVLGLTVLRLTIIETPHIEKLQSRFMLSSEIVSLLLSTSLLLCVVLWFLITVLSGRLSWRRTWFGIAVVIFVVAGIIAVFFASNKRAAVTDLVTLATPMVMAVLLVQWLRSPVTIRLALLLVLAVGVAATVLCIDQKMDSNETVIAEYEANPEEHLQKLGIEPNSMEHWMYEHRVYSRDIRGFLMTSNSAATFFLLALFAAAGLSLQVVSKKMTQQQLASLICYLLAGGIICFGLFLTQSKGGLGALLLGSILLFILLVFGKAVWKRRLLFGVLLLLLIVIMTGVVIHYGTQRGRLPGGNSMLVRWQYWQSAAGMIRDHLLVGVGGGNFPEFYTHYKIRAASETVQNPHNWILSLLAQYGPLGLIGCVAAMMIVFLKGLKETIGQDRLALMSLRQTGGHLWVGLLAVSAGVMLFIRPLLVDAEFLYQQPDVRAAAYLVLYLIPAVVFTVVYLILRAASVTGDEKEPDSRRLSVALMCGLVAVLIHNMVDFAIFEPGNWSAFWLFAAIVIAQIHNTQNIPCKTHIMDPSKRLGLCAGMMLVSIAYVSVVLLPPMRAEKFVKQAMKDNSSRIELVEAAIAADSLSPKTAFQAASVCTQSYQRMRIKDQRMLDQAITFADIAIKRSPADFKFWRLRAKLHVIRSEQTEGQAKKAALQKAFADLQQAIARYPGSGKLHYLLASVAEQLGRDDIALCHYQIAVDIEDAYRAQFRIMYPDRETVFSRLGEAEYRKAKNKVEQLADVLSK